jgi:hypothetical protein
VRSASRFPLRPGAWLLALLIGAPALANDVDGGNDCARVAIDYGDAPEGAIAYPGGVPGSFPTCAAPGPVATRTLVCPGIGIPPGPAGYVRHVASPGGAYWLGCYGSQASPSGVDGEADGKAGAACGVAPDCIENLFGALPSGQDECANDASDAGYAGPGVFGLCSAGVIALRAWNCGAPREAWLNICIDLNADGDWCDAVPCATPQTCASEWAVINVPVQLGSGCTEFDTPAIPTGSLAGPAWMRITLTDSPVPIDFNWNGSASAPGGEFVGGETEDYAAYIDQAVPSGAGTWGVIKTRYR